MKTLLIILALFATQELSATTPRGQILKRLHSDRTSKFINKVWDDADSVSRKFGLPMGLLIAQAILESGWGTSDICINKNNWLGIKDSKKVWSEKKKKWYRPYRTYSSRLACFEHWGRILTDPRYKALPMTSLNICLYLLESNTWHTSETYSNKIRSIYYKYKLGKCDNWGINKK